MADPLSIADSVPALLSVAGKVYTSISMVESSVADAPDSLRAALTAADEMRMTLVSFKELMERLSGLPRERKEMIRLTYLVITFRESVILF
ncbi:hypothetical protein B0T22DRAFT_470649 [Podospora appendiculata]|uniref:Fungal N-terminal domain-containing protein n=1 Tax=Podospora appendiculata TaxID=314037 RepID=A0AAE1C801_9PEZI|nr:hypothetical protein B0T22DRAFT_470649 [Podospora appendiculata]